MLHSQARLINLETTLPVELVLAQPVLMLIFRPVSLSINISPAVLVLLVLKVA
jgi:hypothetical protein